MVRTLEVILMKYVRQRSNAPPNFNPGVGTASTSFVPGKRSPVPCIVGASHRYLAQTKVEVGRFFSGK